VAATAGPAPIRGQTEPRNEAADTDPSAARLKYMKEAAAQYKLRREGDEQALQLEEPILRWSEPVISVLDGITVIWTRNGRPEATVDIWVRVDGSNCG